MNRERKPINSWNGQAIRPGENHDVELAIGESFSGMTVRIPLNIQRAVEPGPAIFVTAALHGDEINGTGAVRTLIQDKEFELTRGSIIFAPVLNLLAFDRHSRYLPDNRDLNRCFPGRKTGTLASRMASTLFDEIVARCDYGIDLHTASVRRTNYPNIRADLKNSRARRIAEAFGSEIILDGKGPKGAFRREACRAGCPTIIMEGGEVCKVEPTIVETAVRGIKNVLRNLDMLDGPPERPDYQIVVERSKWVRANHGGFLQFHVQPGEVVEQDQPLATNTNLLGHDQYQITAPFDGIILGMTTLPSISPGEPICNVGKLPSGTNASDLRRMRKGDTGFEQNVITELGSNVMVVEPEEPPTEDSP